MEIEYSHYQLELKKQLNFISGSSGTRRGILFRLDKKYYADYFPWTEFGDKSVDEFLPLAKNSKLLGKLFELDKLKESTQHKSFTNHTLYTPGQKVESTNSVVKLKAGPDLLDRISLPDGVLRIDFNHTLTKTQLINFWNRLSDMQKSQVEYIEDPCYLESAEACELRNLGIPLAFDRSIETNWHKFKIYKPNIDFYKEFKYQTIFSSYMGHDLGRFHCYLDLIARGDLSLVHGIDTPDIYEQQKKLFIKNQNRLHVDLSVVDAIYKELNSRQWIKIN